MYGQVGLQAMVGAMQSGAKEQMHMSFKNWSIVIGVSVITLLLTQAIFWGAIALIEDVGHAIVH